MPKSTQAGGAHLRSIERAAVALLWGLWVLSALPLVVLFVEFDNPSKFCDIGASYYAKLYGHIFVYPIHEHAANWTLPARVVGRSTGRALLARCATRSA